MQDIIINNISVAFNGKYVLRDVSATFPNGKFGAIMGESGAGKSTLGRVLLGLIKPSYGEVIGVPESKAAVFQSNLLCEDFDAITNVRLVMPVSKSEDVAYDILSNLDLDGKDKNKVRVFSGGMKRRLAIARAIAADADFVLLDEPFKELDLNTKQKVMAYVKQALDGKTVVLITHDIAEAEYFDAHITQIKKVNA